MSTALTTTTTTGVDPATSRAFVALSAGEMPGVQADIAQWCQAKLIALGRELAEARQCRAQAKHAKWASGPWERAAVKLRKQMIYYAKVKAAIAAGYVIVPNFEAEVIAVKVAGNPRLKTGRYPSDVNDAQPELTLGPGQGRYVDETLPATDDSYRAMTPPGKEGNWIRQATSGGWRGYDEEIDFPITMVKPVVLDATHRAMSLKIFDTIGVVNQDGSTDSRARRRSDPLVVGQVIDGSQPKRYGTPKRVTFFIAWWLDTRML